MRIQKKNDALFKAKKSIILSDQNSVDVIQLNSEVDDINSSFAPISGDIITISGDIVSLNQNVSNVDSNLTNLNSELSFAHEVYSNLNLQFYTNSTTPIPLSGSNFMQYTKKNNTVVLITVTFSMTSSSNTGVFPIIYYSNENYPPGPGDWTGSVLDYKVLNNSQTYQFTVENQFSAGTYDFNLAASVTSGGQSMFIDNLSVLLTEIRNV